MVSIVDLMGGSTQNTGGAVVAPGPVVSTTTAPPPPATSTYDPYARERALYPEYFDPITGKPWSSGVHTQLGIVGHTSTTPETHPWLYPQGMVDPVAGKDYGNATYFSGGVAQGFPIPAQMTDAQRQAAADSQNWFRSGYGMDPRLLVGMSRTSSTSPYSNQYGSYTAQNIRWNPVTQSWSFNPNSFSGVNQTGQSVSYTGSMPWGSNYINAVNRSVPGGTSSGSFGGAPGRNPGPGGSGTPGVPPPGSLPRGGGLPGGPPSAGYLGTPGAFNMTPRTQVTPAWWQQLQQQRAQAAALRG